MAQYFLFCVVKYSRPILIQLHPEKCTYYVPAQYSKYTSKITCCFRFKNDAVRSQGKSAGKQTSAWVLDPNFFFFKISTPGNAMAIF